MSTVANDKHMVGQVMSTVVNDKHMVGRVNVTCNVPMNSFRSARLEGFK